MVLDPKVRNLTCFNSSIGPLRYRRLPFGLKNAPRVFQRTMESKDQEGTVAFLDDVLVHGATREQHDKRLRSLLKRLDDHNVCIHEGKNEIGKEIIEFLGHQFSKEGM